MMNFINSSFFLSISLLILCQNITSSENKYDSMVGTWNFKIERIHEKFLYIGDNVMIHYTTSGYGGGGVYRRGVYEMKDDTLVFNYFEEVVLDYNVGFFKDYSNRLDKEIKFIHRTENKDSTSVKRFLKEIKPYKDLSILAEKNKYLRTSKDLQFKWNFEGWFSHTMERTNGKNKKLTEWIKQMQIQEDELQKTLMEMSK